MMLTLGVDRSDVIAREEWIQLPEEGTLATLA